MLKYFEKKIWNYIKKKNNKLFNEIKLNSIIKINCKMRLKLILK